MVNNVGQKPISIREEMPEAAPDAAGWFDWARSSIEVRKEVEEVADEEKNWKVVHPGEVVAFWPSARNKNLQLKARFSVLVHSVLFWFARRVLEDVSLTDRSYSFMSTF